jgi:hypothetical protein
MSSLPPQELGHGSASVDELVRSLQEENAQLREALASRIVIEQAKGAVSARFGILPDEAFELIRGLSRSQRRPLQDFAAEVVRNGGTLDEISGASREPLKKSRLSSGAHETNRRTP